MLEDTGKWKELLSKKDQNMKIWKIFSLSILQNLESVSGKETKNVVVQSFHKEITHGSKQVS